VWLCQPPRRSTAGPAVCHSHPIGSAAAVWRAAVISGTRMDKGSESFKSAVSAAIPGQRGFDYLVVGAGFAGSVLAERLATELGQRVLVVEKRKHIGGNAYDRYNDDGLLIHPYGPHIF